MGILRKILIGVGALVLIVAVVGLLLPRHVMLERTEVVDAPASAVFALVDDFHRFNDWSPWASLDATATYTYDGPRTGVGARLSWAGDSRAVGTGSQEIVESVPYEKVRTRIEFGGQGGADATFEIVPQDVGTRVTWRFRTDLGWNPLGRYVGFFIRKAVGADFARGLANLKELAESLPKVDFAGLDVEEVTAEPATVAYVATTAPKDDAAAISAAISKAYGEVVKFMRANDLAQVAPPVTIDTAWAEGDVYAFEAAIPVGRAPDRKVPEGSVVKVKQTYSGPALKAVHTGPYSGMTRTYEQLFAYAAAHGYERADAPWDRYVSDPADTPENELVTEIYLPVKGEG